MKRDLAVIALCFAAGLSGANVQPVLTGFGKILFPEATPAASISASSGKLTAAAGGTNQNVVLLPSGTGAIQLFNDSPAIALTDASGALTITSGGTNQNIALAPSGTGYTLLGGSVGVGIASPVSLLDVEGSSGGEGVGRFAVNDSTHLETLYLKRAASTTGGLSVVLDESAATSGNTYKLASTDTANSEGAGKFILFGPSGTPLVVTGGGNVGISMTGPNYPLDVTGDINTSTAYRTGGDLGIGTHASHVTITVRNSANSGSCTITVAGGLVIGSSC